MNWYEKFANKKCVFVAAWMPSSFYKKYNHIYDLNEDLHMTLLYIEDFEDNDGERESILRAIKKVASNTPPIKCNIVEMGVMNNSDNTMVVNANVKDGASFYSQLVESVENEWREFDRKYDFLPHISLKYDNKRKTVNVDELKDFSWTINRISVTFNKDDDSKEWIDLCG